MKRGGAIAARLWLAWYGEPTADSWSLFVRACGLDDGTRCTSCLGFVYQPTAAWCQRPFEHDDAGIRT